MSQAPRSSEKHHSPPARAAVFRTFPADSVRALLVFAIGVVAIAVLGALLARLVVGPLADWVSNTIDGPLRRFAEHHGGSWASAPTASAYRDQARLDAADRISSLGGFVVTAAVVVLAGGFWWLRTRDLRPGIVLAATFGGAAFVTLAVKYAVHRSPASGPTGRFSAGTFPSGHALLATAVYGTLAVLLVQAKGRGRPLRIAGAGVLVVTVLAVGASRIYNLDHYASDVLGSFVLGLALVVDATVLARRLAVGPTPDAPPA